jgi:hypothetical protein
MVTENTLVTNYFWCMDPSVQYLMGYDVPVAEGATIHPIVPLSPIQVDDDKIGFTVDVTMRLDQEQSHDDEQRGVVVPIVESPQERLADSA